VKNSGSIGTRGRETGARDVGRRPLYEVARWGNGYFAVNAAGHLQVHPPSRPRRAIDLKELVDRLQLRGISLPVLIRFTDILKHRLGEIHSAFQAAIAQHQYQGGYSCVYPIKVNQQRQVVEEVLNFGRPYGFGLEAGSKPELLAVVALADNDTPIICNGFKDAEFIETAMLAQKIGRNIIPVVEKYTELDLILDTPRRSACGRRSACASSWPPAAAGAGSLGRLPLKFGLTVSEILRGLEELKRRGHAGLLQAAALPPRQPDHQHPHRQGRADRGGARLCRAGQARRRPRVPRRRRRPGRRLRRLADQLRVEHELHAAGVRQRRRLPHPDRLRRAGVPHPTIISESGRAIVAYHSVLVFNVLGVSGFGDRARCPDIHPDWEQPLVDLVETYNNLTPATRSRASTTPSRRWTWR
jgi:arginine decarboxylase